MNEPVLVCGFEVVRKANANFDASGRGAYSASIPRLDDTLYHGLDRMPWFDVDELYYSQAISETLDRYRTDLRKSSSDRSGIYLVRTLDLALKIKACIDAESPPSRDRNEIIALYSPKLEKEKGSTCVGSGGLLNIGFDVVGIGEWSLVRDGIFDGDHLKREWGGKLNRWGLFDRVEDCSSLRAAYDKASRLGLVESLDAGTTVEPVRVYRVI